MSDLKGKTAIVTGASKGIGASIARALGKNGAAVVVNYAGDKAGAEKVVKAIQDDGGRAVAVQADVSKAADVQRLFGVTKEAFGPVDVLVNNAGVYAFYPISDVTEAEYRRQFDINVLGTLLTTQEAAKHFGNKGGSVINISSVASEKPMPGASVYGATKAAVDQLSASLAAELGPRGIRVNVIAPGGVETEGTVTAGTIGSDFEQRMVAETPLGRLGQPDDIAGVAVFLASDASRWITGGRLQVSGGAR